MTGSVPRSPLQVSGPEFLTVLVFAGLALGGMRSPWAWSLLALPLWAAAGTIPLPGEPMGTVKARRPLPERATFPGAFWPWDTPRVGTSVGALWLAFLGWAVLSGLLSAEPLRALPVLARKATALLVLLGALRARDEERKLWFGLLACLSVVLGLAALFVSSPRSPMSGLYYPYYNYTACVEACALVACVALLAAPGRRRGRAPLAVLAAFCLALLLLARSRGGLAASAAICALLLWRSGRRRLLGGAGLAALLALWLLPAGVLSPLLKLELPGAFVRPQIWRSAVETAADHPWLGEGPGQFDRGFLRHSFPAPAGSNDTRYGRRSAHAHSEPLQAAAETGWPGLALYLLALAWSLLRAWRAPSSPYRDAALGAAGVIAVQSLADNLFALPALEWLFFYCLGATMGEEAGPAPKLTSAAGRAFRLAGLLSCALAWWPGWAVQSYLAKARASGDKGVEWVRRALRIAPEDPELWTELARARLRESPPDVAAALESLAQAERRDPYDPIHAVMACEVLRGRGAWSPVLVLAQRALELEPGFLQARLLAAEALRHLGREAEAREQLARFDAAGAPRPETMQDGYAVLIMHRDLERRRALGDGSPQ